MEDQRTSDIAKCLNDIEARYDRSCKRFDMWTAKIIEACHERGKPGTKTVEEEEMPSTSESEAAKEIVTSEDTRDKGHAEPGDAQEDKRRVEKDVSKSKTWVEVVRKEQARGAREKEKVEKKDSSYRVAKAGENGKNKEWQQEMRRRRIKARNGVFWGVGKREEGDKERVEEWIGNELGRKVDVEELWIEKEDLLIARLKRIEDARETVERRDEIWERCEMWVDKDRTFKERRNRWMVKERAREERRGGKKVIEEEDRVNIDGTWWYWLDKEEEWAKEDKEVDTKGVINQAQVEWRKEDVIAWRKDLEQRKAELRKDEERLGAEERKMLAREESEKSMEGLEREKAKNDAVDEHAKGKPNGEKELTEKGSRKKEKKIEKEKPRQEEKKIEKEKPRQEEKRVMVKDAKENRNKKGRVESEMKRVDVEKWKIELIRRKKEMREEEKALEEVERIVLGLHSPEKIANSILNNVER